MQLLQQGFNAFVFICLYTCCLVGRYFTLSGLKKVKSSRAWKRHTAFSVWPACRRKWHCCRKISARKERIICFTWILIMDIKYIPEITTLKNLILHCHFWTQEGSTESQSCCLGNNLPKHNLSLTLMQFQTCMILLFFLTKKLRKDF